MKSKIILITLAIFLLSGFILGQDTTSTLKTKPQKVHPNKNFVDANGDGYNDNAPDHDGDGIPNGLDPDYIKLKKRKNRKELEYIDSDGDGINDNLQLRGRRKNRGRHFNKSDQNVRPQNASGNEGTGTSTKNSEQKGKGKGRGKG